MLETIPLQCPHCGEVSHHAVAWVQEHSRAACRHCGAGFCIDKDRLALWLAAQERDGEPAAATPLAADSG